MEKQKVRKVDRARDLANARAEEYRRHHQLLRRVTKSLTSSVPVSQTGLAPATWGAQLLALSTAFVVVASGAVLARADTLPRIAESLAAVAQNASSGFSETFGDVPSHIISRIGIADALVSASVARVASARDAYESSMPLAQVNATTLSPLLVKDYHASNIAVGTAPALLESVPPVTAEDLYAAVLEAYAFVTTPSQIADAVGNAGRVLASGAYAEASSALSAYGSIIGGLQTAEIAMGNAALGAFVTVPSIVASADIALGNAIITGAHAAIHADVFAAYGIAAAAPASARSTVAFLGTTGSILAGATARVPALATTAYLRATGAPAVLAPALARAVFGAEYAIAAPFVGATNALSDRYLALVEGTGRLAYQGTEGALAIVGVAAHAPVSIRDAHLGAPGESALALGAVTPVSSLAAVAAAAQPVLSAGEQAALSVYRAVHAFFGTTGDSLAALFNPATSTVPVPTRPPAATPEATSTGLAVATPAASLQPTPVLHQTVNTYPTYTTVVQGVSQSALEQALASLRSDILSTTADMIKPVAAQGETNATTIQYVNMFQNLSDLTVSNGTFKGGTFDGGSVTGATSISSANGIFTGLTSGTTTLGATSVAGGLTVTGDVGIGTTSPGSLLSLGGIANFTAATSTFYGNGINLTNGCFAVNGVCVSGGGGGSGGVGSGAQGQLAFYNAAGTDLTATSSLFLSQNGNFGIGTTSPPQALSVEGNGLFSGDLAAANITATGTLAATSLVLSTALPITSGGTGASSFTPGSLLYGAGTGPLQSVATSTLTGTSITIGGSGALVGGTGLTANLNLANANTWTALQTFSNGVSLTGSKLTDLANGTSPNDAVNYSQLTAMAVGLDPINPIATPGIIDDSLSTPPVSPVNEEGYIVGPSPTGSWAGLAGHMLEWSSTASAWVDVLNRAVAIGDRFGVAFETGTPSGGLTGKKSDVATFTNATPGSYAYTFTAPVNTMTTAVDGVNSHDVGHMYYYNATSTAWVDFATGVTPVAGNGLSLNGAVLSLNLANPNTWTALQQFNANASTTELTTTGSTYLATAGGNVGVGTTSPLDQLDVYGVGGVTASHGLFESNTTSSAGIRMKTTQRQFSLESSSNQFQINDDTAGMNRIVIDSSGNVGIGTTTPWGQLSVNPNALGSGVPEFVIGSSTATSLIVTNGGYLGLGTTTPGSLLSLAGIASFTTATSTFYSSGGINLSSGCFSVNGVCAGTGSGGVGAGTQGQFPFYNAAGTNLVATSTLTLTQAGYFGIGTTSPFTTLGVVGNERIKTTTNMDNAFTVENASATSTLAVSTLDSSSNIFSVASSTGQSFFEITAAGNVGLGTTSPETTLTVVGAICAARSAGTQTAACGTTQGAIYANSSSLTGGYDVAEMYPTSDATLGAGDVVSFDTTSAGSVARAATTTAPFLGIVSTSPGLTLGSSAGGALPLTLAGRVPTKVSAANGPIATGDRLALSSTTPGVAVKALHSGETIGVALAPYSGAGTGSVDVFVSPQYWLAPGDITIDPTSGMVGIGTTTPNHNLTVAGDVGAIAFVNTSTRDAKDDISYISPAAAEDMFNQLVNLKVATYRYKIEDQNDPLRLGFIAEDAQTVAPEVLSPDGKGVDLYKLATFTLSGVQTLAAKVSAQDLRLTSLESRVAALESGSVSVASGSPLALGTSTLASALQSFGALIGKGIAQFNTLVFRQLVASTDSSGTSSAGSVTLLAGNTVAQVNNALVLPTTKVFVTFNSQITGSWWVSDKTTGSFRVVLSAPQTGDVSFDYFLVQTEGQIATSTPDGSFPSITQSSGPDTVPPVITLLGNNPLYLAVGSVFTEPGVSVTDNVDGTDPYITFVNGIQQVVSSTTIDTSSPMTYLITYKATDQAGNTATVMRSVIIGNPDGTVTTTGTTATTTSSTDTTPPVVTLNGAAAMNINQGSAFTDPGATALDNVDGNLTSKIVETGAVDTATIGAYTLTYSATDAAGNTGSASRLVSVVAASTTTTTTATSTPPADTTPPVVTLNGAATMSLTQGGTFTDPGATALDNVDGDLTAKIVETGTVDAATAGSYTLTYSATDAAGNTGSASRAVTVAASSTATSTPSS